MSLVGDQPTALKSVSVGLQIEWGEHHDGENFIAFGCRLFYKAQGATAAYPSVSLEPVNSFYFVEKFAPIGGINKNLNSNLSNFHMPWWNMAKGRSREQVHVI